MQKYNGGIKSGKLWMKVMATKSIKTPAMVDEICERVANGEPLRQICREPNMPSWTTFYNWINASEELAARFARARDLGADAIAEEALAIIDTDPERILSEGGNRVDSGYVQWQKNRVEMRLKLLAKWSPKKYGDRQVLAGDESAPLNIVHDFTPLEAIISAAQLKRQSDD